MAVNNAILRAQKADGEQYLAQIEKISNSGLLHGAESLCRLLRYLARTAVDHPGVHLKEYQIATEVFGRSSDFDPQMDSTVRVQVGRLRQKLHEYYSAEGINDPVLVDLPKGTYALGLHHRTQLTAAKERGPQAVPLQPAERNVRNWTFAVVVLSLLLAGAIAMIVVQRIGGGRSAAAEAAENSSPAAFRIFWKPF